MDTRLATIWPRHQYTADATEIITVDIKDPVSQLAVIYEPDNNPSGTHATAHPVRCISNIKLLDGSDQLFQLSGAEAQAVDFYHNKKVPHNVMCYLNGMYSTMIMNLNFGRYLFDPEYALVPSMHGNLQLEITIDIDAGGDEPNDGYLTVLGRVFDEKTVSPLGYLRHRVIKSYTLENSGHEYTDIPIDMLLKQIFVRCQRYGTGPEYQIDNIKMSEDGDKRIPIDHTLVQLIETIGADWPEFEEWILVHGSTTVQYFYNTPCYWPTFYDTQWRNSYAAAEACCYEGDGGRFQHDAEASGPNHQVYCRGFMPHAVMPILPDFGMDVASWYDVTRLGSLKLDVTAGSSVGTSQTAQIIVQQLKRY